MFSRLVAVKNHIHLVKTLLVNIIFGELTMSFIKTGINFSFCLLSGFLPMFVILNESKPKYKIHDYSQLVRGRDYVFDPLHGGLGGYMTATGKGIKPRDYIVLQYGCKSYQYKVEEIDYYSDPSDMWMALVKQVILD